MAPASSFLLALLMWAETHQVPTAPTHYSAWLLVPPLPTTMRNQHFKAQSTQTILLDKFNIK